MEPQAPIGDDDLHAYVDDRLDEPRRKQVARYLAANPALRQRVEDWQAQAEGLRQALRQDDAPKREVILARLAERQMRAASPFRQRPWAAAAGMLLALLLGGAGGWIARGDSRPTEITRLGMEAASAYRIFANDPAHAIEISSKNRAELIDWMTQKLGRRVMPPDLTPMGYQLMGGRVLAALYGPAAMLIYRDAADNRITIYVQPMRIGAPASMQPMETQAVDGYAWIERQIGYTVMSEGDRAKLQSVADQVKADTQS